MKPSRQLPRSADSKYLFDFMTFQNVETQSLPFRLVTCGK